MADHYRQGAVDVIRTDDVLGREQVEPLWPLVEQALRSGQPQLVVDLRDVRLIDSKGLEFLLDARDRCLRKGGLLRVACSRTLPREVLRVTGLDELMEVFPDAMAAAGSFAQ